MLASNNNLDSFYDQWHRHRNCLFDIIKLVALLWLALIPAHCSAQAPHAPTGLAATASSQQVKLVWVAPAGTPAATGYNLKRSTNFQGP